MASKNRGIRDASVGRSSEDTQTEKVTCFYPQLLRTIWGQERKN